MKQFATMIVMLVVAALGVTAAFAITKHTGSSIVDCKGVTYNFVDFANLPNNKVNYKVLVDSSIAAQGIFTFNGANSGPKNVPLNLNGDHLIQATANWNTNGHSGSFDSGLVHQVCTSQTVTTGNTTTVGTTTTVQNTTTVGTTQTQPGTTIQNTTTAPAQTVTNTVTVDHPAQTVTQIQTVTQTLPVRTVTITRTLTSPPPKRTVHKLTKKQKCLALNKKIKGKPTKAQPGLTYVWKNGHCYSSSTG